MGTHFLDYKNHITIPENLVYINRRFRYVNHRLKMATTGFSNQDLTIAYKDFIAFNDEAIAIMKQRCIEIYETDKNTELNSGRVIEEFELQSISVTKDRIGIGGFIRR